MEDDDGGEQISWRRCEKAGFLIIAALNCVRNKKDFGFHADEFSIFEIAFKKLFTKLQTLAFNFAQF